MCARTIPFVLLVIEASTKSGLILYVLISASTRTGVKLFCIVDAGDFDWNTDEFGPDTRQDVTFAFQRDMLIDVNFRPDIGDIVSWNSGYFEIISFDENQLVGGDVDNSHSIVAQARLTRMPTTNLEEYRGY